MRGRVPSGRLRSQALGYGTWGVQRDGLGGEVFGFSPDLHLDGPEDLAPDLADHADLKELIVEPGDLLLATDGLWRAADPALPPPTELWIMMTSGDHEGAGLQVIAEAALDAGGGDDTTLVLGALAVPGGVSGHDRDHRRCISHAASRPGSRGAGPSG